MKWIIFCVVLAVLISQSYCFPSESYSNHLLIFKLLLAKADSTANKGKTNEGINLIVAT